jgi:hypothetical protein
VSDDIFGAIDGALADYAISPDAMRWTPAAPKAYRAYTYIDEVQLTAEALHQAMQRLTAATKRVATWFAEMDPLTRSALCLSHDVPDIWAERERAELRAADPRAHALAAKATRGTGPERPHPGRDAYRRNR